MRHPRRPARHLGMIVYMSSVMCPMRGISKCRFWGIAMETSSTCTSAIVPCRDVTRRFWKKSPSTVLTPDQRLEVCEAALLIARQIHYESAGTVEFILDQDSGRFYFLEMNTRIQVEHPVTEMITGLDLIKEQIRIAGGRPAPLFPGGYNHPGTCYRMQDQRRVAGTSVLSFARSDHAMANAGGSPRSRGQPLL